MEPDKNNFGARLRSLIEQKGCTVKTFASEYGITESQAHNWLNKESPPLAKHWPRLANYFGCSQEYIATGIPKKVEPADSDLDTTDLRTMLDDVIKAAEGQRNRIAWIREQMRAHLAPPIHWRGKEWNEARSLLSGLGAKTRESILPPRDQNPRQIA